MILQMHSGKIIIINISSFKVPWFMFSFPDTQDARRTILQHYAFGASYNFSSLYCYAKLSHTPHHVYGDHWMSFLTSTILQHDSGLQNLENSIVESDREGFLSSWAWWVFFSSRRSFQQTSLNILDFLSPGQEFSSSLQILQVSFQLFLWFF